MIRERGLQLREGTLKSRGEALLPLMLASYVFESLVLTNVNVATDAATAAAAPASNHRLLTDELV